MISDLGTAFDGGIVVLCNGFGDVMISVLGNGLDGEKISVLDNCFGDGMISVICNLN